MSSPHLDALGINASAMLRFRKPKRIVKRRVRLKGSAKVAWGIGQKQHGLLPLVSDLAIASNEPEESCEQQINHPWMDT